MSKRFHEMHSHRTAILLCQHPMSQMRAIRSWQSSFHKSFQSMKGCESMSTRTHKMHSDRTAILLSLQQFACAKAAFANHFIRRSNLETTLLISPIGTRKLMAKLQCALNDRNSSTKHQRTSDCNRKWVTLPQLSDVRHNLPHVFHHLIRTEIERSEIEQALHGTVIPELSPVELHILQSITMTRHSVGLPFNNTPPSPVIIRRKLDLACVRAARGNDANVAGLLF
jgi:hypothetical protein